MSGADVPWDTGGVEQRRLEFVRAALTPGANLSEVCRRFEVSRKTGYKWLGRYRSEGVAGLADRSRARRTQSERTSPEVEKLICDTRREFPLWGARKLVRVLTRRGETGLPAVSTVTEILRRHDLLNGPGTGTKTWNRFVADAPNDLWQMDFKGWFDTIRGGRCEPFDILDDHSRFNLCLDAYGTPTEHMVKTRLQAVFSEYGMPRKILTDNGSPWANTQAGFRWTGLGVWLLDLGVELTHSSIRHPQTIGKDERFHRTLSLEVINTKPSWENLTEVQAAFDRWRPIYNTQRPHDALDGDVPADHYQPSTISYPTRIEPATYPDDYLVRKVGTKAQISLHDHRYRIGTAFAGKHVGITPTTPESDTYNVYYRTTLIRQLTRQQ